MTAFCHTQPMRHGQSAGCQTPSRRPRGGIVRKATLFGCVAADTLGVPSFSTSRNDPMTRRLAPAWLALALLTLLPGCAWTRCERCRGGRSGSRGAGRQPDREFRVASRSGRLWRAAGGIFGALRRHSRRTAKRPRRPRRRVAVFRAGRGPVDFRFHGNDNLRLWLTALAASCMVHARVGRPFRAVFLSRRERPSSRHHSLLGSGGPFTARSSESIFSVSFLTSSVSSASCSFTSLGG